jgi:hypothetical protein
MNSKELRRLAGTEYMRMALIALGVVALLAVVIWVPKLSFVQPGGLTKATDRAKAESDLRGHLLQALAGLVLAVGAFYTGRTFALNREGQITERFTRAVEQLANEKLDLQLGGIYALERIAQDSKTHYEPVMEVLTAFLRENTRWRREKAAEKAEETPQEPGAFLFGADLSSVHPGLTQSQIDSASTDAATILPKYLQEGASQGPSGEPNV